MRAHTELGDTMLPWAIALAVIALTFLARKLLADRAARRGAPVGAEGPGTARAPSAGRSTSWTAPTAQVAVSSRWSSPSSPWLRRSGQ